MQQPTSEAMKIPGSIHCNVIESICAIVMGIVPANSWLSFSFMDSHKERTKFIELSEEGSDSNKRKERRFTK